MQHADQHSLRISTAQKEGILQASKWLKVQILLDHEEMQDLLRNLGDMHFVIVSGPVCGKDVMQTADTFLTQYTKYIQLLQQGHIPDDKEFRQIFSSSMSATLDSFYAIQTGPEKYLVKPLKPVIQLQAHDFFYSELDGKFHPMVLSKDSVSWGLQFSYPQFFQDPKTRQIVKTTDPTLFPNTSLFKTLMRSIRSSSLPTPFAVKGVRTNSPIRIGKKVLQWIHQHPQLKNKGIQIL